MNLPQVGDTFRLTHVEYPNNTFSLDKEYVVTKVEYPDEFLENWFYLVDDNGEERPFLAYEISIYLRKVETLLPDSPSWTL